MEGRIYHHLVPIDNLNQKQALHHISQLLKEGTSPNQLVTLNIAMYIEARRNHKFRHILESAYLVLPESVGLRLYSCFNPPRLVRTNGLLFAGELMKLCAEQNQKVVVFGASEESRRLAVQRLQTTISNLNIMDIQGDYKFSNETDSQYVTEKIGSSNASLALMAGTEVEAEEWIYRRLIQGNVEVRLAGNFGQTIDVWAEKKKYIPELARKYGFEWLFRLIYDSPERKKRYRNVLVMFGRMAIMDMLKKHEL